MRTPAASTSSSPTATGPSTRAGASGGPPTSAEVLQARLRNGAGPARRRSSDADELAGYPRAAAGGGARRRGDRQARRGRGEQRRPTATAGRRSRRSGSPPTRSAAGRPSAGGAGCASRSARARRRRDRPAVAGILDAVDAAGRIEDDAVGRATVREGEVAMPCSSPCRRASGATTPSTSVRRRQWNSEVHELRSRDTGCTATMPDGAETRFRGARQGVSATLGDASSVGHFSSQPGAVTRPVRLLPGALRSGRRRADVVPYVVTPGTPNGVESGVGLILGGVTAALLGGVDAVQRAAREAGGDLRERDAAGADDPEDQREDAAERRVAEHRGDEMRRADDAEDRAAGALRPAREHRPDRQRGDHDRDGADEERDGLGRGLGVVDVREPVREQREQQHEPELDQQSQRDDDAHVGRYTGEARRFPVVKRS